MASIQMKCYLYMAALTAEQVDKELAEYYQCRITEDKKNKMLVTYATPKSTSYPQFENIL